MVHSWIHLVILFLIFFIILFILFIYTAALHSTLSAGILVFRFVYQFNHLTEIVDMTDYTEDAGLEIAMILVIASLFSRQVAISNAGPTSALESMGAKQQFRCNFFNIALIYNSKREKDLFGPQKVK